MAGDTLTRIAIVSDDKCKPKKCRQECKKVCPVVRMGKLCIEAHQVGPLDQKAFISETLCIGCGLCPKKCPFDAIQIINLPTNLSTHVTHRYGANSFKLHRLPSPRPGFVLGLVGSNGTGKSTALQILGGKVKPNLGRFDDPPDWQEILRHYRGNELMNYFTKILEDNIKVTIKPQYVDQFSKLVKATTTCRMQLEAKDNTGRLKSLVERLELSEIMDRPIANLSGGESQRFVIAMAAIQKADTYMFDEPSSFLDVRQRLEAARVIRSMVTPDTYVICVEHDLSILDYMSDHVCCLYGRPSVYGVVTMPFTVREGINIFLDGYLTTENMRFRDEPLTFKITDQDDGLPVSVQPSFKYPAMTKTFKGFKLTVEAGQLQDSQIIVMLGENGTGKSTFVQMIAGREVPDGMEEKLSFPISYKRQSPNPKGDFTVRQVLTKTLKGAHFDPRFQTEVYRPMAMDDIIDQEVSTLSGGEIQRVAIVLCLGVSARIYLIDEPSAYLDSEQRIIASKVIKRWIMSSSSTALIIEHDLVMATYLADRVIVFEGQPAVAATATQPQGVATGMNKFLASLDITFRRDPTNFRPRVNKLHSVKDEDQKASGNYYFIGD